MGTERAQVKEEGITDFAFLAQGRSLGKNVNLLIIGNTDTEGVNQGSEINILELKGPDEAAQNVQVTILPPRAIRVGQGSSISIARAKELVDEQRAQGTIDWSENEIKNVGMDDTPIIVTIEWGIGGVNNKTVEVDVSNGLNLNLTCSFLRIGCEIDPLLEPLSQDSGDISKIYEISAFVGPGYAKPNNAQRSIHLGRVFSTDTGSPPFFGTSPVVPIPKYATRATVCLGTTGETDPATFGGWICQIVFFKDYNGGFAPNPDPTTWTGMLAIYTIADNGNGDKYVPIPNGAKYAAIRQENSFTVFPILIFDLGI